ncbi:THUMP domain-containing class I SAM-dependent RNA methyltransferase [Roseicyclus marinus]|uniref:THUMP domain-containing class I SAM-dependent RNA methyltransferase n=1 Tax=Roseicyclus marinus TaxID=2161673 RepID=UPI00240FC918|nr:class I SAM-dependent RNA methyltransferase [Roseicyclus marinus]MDG3041220.1 class I SAM-dependent RNA methyltransferase [Roseicyclus marinus]
MADDAPGPVTAPGGLFLVAVPGLEAPLAAEATAKGFSGVTVLPGGVEVAGGLPEAIRANLVLRCAVRVLWRVAAFRALHLAQLDKRARKLPWADWLSPDQPVRVEAVCRASRIYHHKAAAQRIAGAIAAAGIPVSGDAAITLKARIEDDLCTISLDTTGEPLHRRGHKSFVGKAPLRETMAAGFLWQMGFDGTQAVVDPMCGSGTIPMEAAEIALDLVPGRSRDFAFAHLVGGGSEGPCPSRSPPYLEEDEGGARFFGFDRDDGAIRGARGNAERAGLSEICLFTRQTVSDLVPPEGVEPGIVLTNPPYGARIGERKLLFAVYGALGATLKARFSGWQVGIITSDKGLAQATGLGLEALGPVDHSGTKVWLWRGRIA